jgi:hypothetical protein
MIKLCRASSLPCSKEEITHRMREAIARKSLVGCSISRDGKGPEDGVLLNGLVEGKTVLI